LVFAPQCLINAETIHLGTGTTLSDFPTSQELPNSATITDAIQMAISNKLENQALPDDPASRGKSLAIKSDAFTGGDMNCRDFDNV
jgi:hypothetical protein